jgi:hypothetical protein
MTGGGGYGTDFNRRKLKRIARDMNYVHPGVSGMGSTWFVLYLSRKRICYVFYFRYGSAHDAYVVANHTLHGMLWLAQYEFATPERDSKLGTLMWPEW